MNRNGDDQCVFSAQLTRLRDAPVRFAFATLVGSFRFWAGLVVGLPFVSLSAALGYNSLVPVAAGVPIGVCLWLQWMGHEFIHPRFIVDSENRTLTKSKPYGNGTYRPIGVEVVDRVSIIQHDQFAIVRLQYAERGLSKPLAAAVLASDVADLKLQLERLGIDVSIRQLKLVSLSKELTGVRILGTPIAIAGSLIVIWELFGSEAFLSGAVVVPAITIVVFGIVSSISKRRR